MSIRWDVFEPQGYEDMVSVLLSRLYPDARRIDGKGGDGGRDVQIAHGRDGQIAHAFELKSFAGRMTWSRRGKVARSLERVAALGPARWTLVVPIDPTPAEDKWFRKLGAGYSFPTEWYGKTWLDEKMSAFPDIRRYFVEGASDEVLRSLLELHKEQAIVTDVGDATGRLRTLRERLNEIDPYYRYEMSTGPEAVEHWPSAVVFAVRFGDVRIDVYPKYSGAVKDRPISMGVMVALEPEDPVIQDSLGYGLAVTIPNRMISSVTIDAPSGLGGNFTEAELNLFPTDTRLHEPVTLALDIMDGDNLIASCPVHLTEGTRGPKGFTFSGHDSTGCLEICLKVNAVDEEVEVEFQLDFKPALPATLVPLFRWLDGWQPPHRLAIHWPGVFEVCGEVREPFLGDHELGRVVEELAYLQDRSGKYWEMPPFLSNNEGRDILNAASLMKGESIDLRWRSFNMNMDQWDPKLQELEDGGAQQLMLEHGISLRLQGVEIPIGRVRTYITSARLADPESVKRDLASGSVPPLRLVPGDSDHAQRVPVPRPR